MARVYKRDSRGRFASGGGSTSSSRRPPARAISRGPNRLTRDNGGRITSQGGNGATARGGRLRTAGGNLRATQTTRLQSRRVGRLAKPQAGVNVQQGRTTAATGALRRGEFVRANLRPRNTMAKPVKSANPFHRFSGHTDENVAKATKMLQKQGFDVYVFNERSNSRIAEALLGKRRIGINAAADFWSNPRLRAIDYRRSGHLSTSSPLGVIHHEIAHTKDMASLNRFARSGMRGVNDWKEIVPGSGGPATKLKESWRRRDLARRVSAYASSSPAEFIAETYAGRRTGRRYDHQVMRAYREAMGLPALSVRRTIPRSKPR